MVHANGSGGNAEGFITVVAHDGFRPIPLPRKGLHFFFCYRFGDQQIAQLLGHVELKLLAQFTTAAACGS